MTPRFFKLPVDMAAREDLPASAKLVYAAIVDRIGRNATTWAGVRTLAKDTAQDKSTVVEAVRRLAGAGLLICPAAERGKRRHLRLPSAGAADAGGECPKNPDTSGDRQRTPVSQKAGQGCPKNPDTSVRETRTEPDRPELKTGSNGALVALFCDMFREKVGEPFTGDRGKLAGNLKRLANVHGPDVVQARITRWFGADRPDYGPELFILRFQGAELRGAGAGTLSGSELMARKAWGNMEADR